jgi:RNA polymerase-binding transcription factor DksA
MAAQRWLVRERAFRVNQLAELDAGDGERDVARREIHAALRAAAHSVLAEIDAALCRIEECRYGRCYRCGGYMSWDRLRALPMSSLCGWCQRIQEVGRAQSAALEGSPPVSA